MNLIFFDTSIQAAVSIYLSCKYWRDKYDRIINHDTINLLINSRYIEDRKETLYSIKNGCGKKPQIHLNLPCLIMLSAVSSYTGPNYYNTSTIIERGFFSSVRHLAEFLQSFNKIMTEPVEDIERSSVEYCFLRTTAPSSISKYFSYNSSDQIFPLGMQRMSLQTADQLKDLMNWCKYCNQPQEMAFNAEEAEQLANLKLIEIRSRHRKTLKDNYNWNINAKIDGDGNFSISVKNIHLHIRSSPMIYKELTEVLKYSTHKKDISENMAKKSKVIVEAFELTLKENNERKLNFLFWKFQYTIRLLITFNVLRYYRALYSRV